ncbi:DNA processing protein [Escherichia coli]|nr:DNA processing protein [Escherichia coli]
MCNGVGTGGRGTAVGVLADSLLKTSTLVKWREGLIAGNLVLISPFYPEVRFTVGNAMARNKYIYCLAESAMVVRAGMTGGTITGAMEALKHQWLPVQVKPNQDMQSANSRLVENGASWSAEQAENVTIRLPDVPGLMYDRALRNAQPELFSLHEDDANYASNARVYACRFLSTLCGGTGDPCKGIDKY